MLGVFESARDREKGKEKGKEKKSAIESKKSKVEFSEKRIRDVP